MKNSWKKCKKESKLMKNVWKERETQQKLIM